MSMNSWLRTLIMALILAIVFTWFALSNSQIEKVSILIWSFQIPLSLLILVSILIGIIFTGIVFSMEQTKLLGKMRELERKLKTEEEILKGEKKK
jgi:uncharacterized integral membrane protein